MANNEWKNAHFITEFNNLYRAYGNDDVWKKGFADLGYGDRLLGGALRETSYSFELPVEWRLADSAYLELYFAHSQRIKYENSSLTVLLNGMPIATVSLDDETALNGHLKINLPVSQARYGGNRISIQSAVQSVDPCASSGTWIFISSESRLYLPHQEDNDLDLLLDFYPHPFSE